MTSASDPRAAALNVIAAVLNKHRQLDEALEHALNRPDSHTDLDRRDRAFVRLLAATVLRRLGQLDDVLDALVDRPLPPRLTKVRNTLRLGAAQILFLDTPPHAAVNQTVELAGRKSPFRGLVNAVLRRLTKEGEALLRSQDAPRLNTPGWLWQSWCTAYGDSQARLIAEAHMTEPPLDLSVKSDGSRWAARLDAEVLPSGTLRRTGGGLVEQLPGYSEGAWWVQDVASALPAPLLLSSVDGNPKDLRILDACAAPGGKTAQLAVSGAAVDALDISSKRLERLESNMRRLKLDVNLTEADMRSWQAGRQYAAILIDAPCTATGTVRRHPDIPYLREQSEVERLATQQSQMIHAAAGMLQPGGVLVYCTCSLQPEEGINQIQRTLATEKLFDRWPISKTLVPGFEDAILPDGDVQVLPSHMRDAGGTDGFFIARLRRRT